MTKGRKNEYKIIRVGGGSATFKAVFRNAEGSRRDT